MPGYRRSVVADHLTAVRLHSYQVGEPTNAQLAVELYDWNLSVGGSLFEDLGRLEVIFRNAFDAKMTEHGHRQGWTSNWLQRAQLFPGKNNKSWNDIRKAEKRLQRQSSHWTHGKLVAELNFGFLAIPLRPGVLLIDVGASNRFGLSAPSNTQRPEDNTPGRR